MMNDNEISQGAVAILISEQEDSFSALLTAREVARHAGFDGANEVLIATVVSELATNIIRYAKSGKILLRIIHKDGLSGLEVKAIDEGPGIHNIELAMTDNYTTTKDSLGLGLSTLKRIMDEYEIQSVPGKGTSITARKWRK